MFGCWLYDVTAKRGLALTITTSFFGSVDHMLKINLRTSKASEACEELEKALKHREKTKNPRIQEEEEKNNVACDISNIKKEFSGQLSALDLNLRFYAEEEEEAKSASQTSTGCVERFLDSIKNRFDFNVLSKEI
ncbi:hypothetical protein Bca101_015246 [Brassica carinata]